MAEQLVNPDSKTDTPETAVKESVKAERMAYAEDPYRVMAKNGREAGLSDEAILEVLNIATTKSEAEGEEYDAERKWVHDTVFNALEAAAGYIEEGGDKVTSLAVGGDDDSLNQEAFGEILTMLGAEEVGKRDRFALPGDRWPDPRSSFGERLNKVRDATFYKSNLGIGVEKVVTRKGQGHYNDPDDPDKTYLFAAPLDYPPTIHLGHLH